jgi:hypothetical protein
MNPVGAVATRGPQSDRVLRGSRSAGDGQNLRAQRGVNSDLMVRKPIDFD